MLARTMGAAFVLGAAALLAADRPAQAGGPTTADKFEWVQKPELPRVSERAERGEVVLQDAVLHFPINVWGGWAPIIAANGGFKPNPESIFTKRYGVKLQIDIVEDPSEVLTRYVNGESPVLWGTVDMLVLFSSQLVAGPRPRVFQQIDWSNGGDGIVVRSNRVRTANDLRGKTVVLAAFSPSHYYLLTILKAAGIPPREVKLRFTKTAFGAAKAFVDDPAIDAMVSFAPDIYNIPGDKTVGKGTKLLTSTGDARRLIADCWAVREDFAKAHPKIVKGLVQGIFDGMEVVRKNPDLVAKQMFEGFKAFGLPSVDDCKGMLADAHLTNYAENLELFTDPKNPTSFTRLWDDAARLYRDAGAVTETLAAKDVADPSLLLSSELRERWKGSTSGYQQVYELSAEKRERLVERRETGAIVTMIVYFAAAEERFDEQSPEVLAALEEVAKLAGKFSGALVLVEGYTDPLSSGIAELEKRRRDNQQVARVIAARQRRLKRFSKQRAAFVQRALHERYGLDPAQFQVVARGGARPVTRVFSERGKNRRVEVSVIALEGE